MKKGIKSLNPAGKDGLAAGWRGTQDHYRGTGTDDPGDRGEKYRDRHPEETAQGADEH